MSVDPSKATGRIVEIVERLGGIRHPSSANIMHRHTELKVFSLSSPRQVIGAGLRRGGMAGGGSESSDCEVTIIRSLTDTGRSSGELLDDRLYGGKKEAFDSREASCDGRLACRNSTGGGRWTGGGGKGGGVSSRWRNGGGYIGAGGSGRKGDGGSSDEDRLKR